MDRQVLTFLMDRQVGLIDKRVDLFEVGLFEVGLFEGQTSCPLLLSFILFLGKMALLGNKDIHLFSYVER